MTGIPVLAVLIVGLAAGLAVASRLRGERSRGKKKNSARLEVADLEARRDELFGALREGVGDNERALLEDAAARTLRDLDQARAALGGSPKKAKKKKGKQEEQTVSPEEEARVTPGPRHSAFTGFLYGVGLVGLVATLVFWAQRDATPKPDDGSNMAAGGPAALSARSIDENHEVGGALSAEDAAHIETLQATLENDPANLGARKDLALTLMDNGLLFPAFEHSQKILAQEPEDPDGLFIEAVVRFAMGNVDQTIELLDRVVDRYPTHVRAFAIRGLALLRKGDREAAISSWEAGLVGAGGSHPQLEDLLAKARAGQSAPEILGGPAAPPSPPLERSTTPPSDAFSVLVEGPSEPPPPGAVMFVSLRQAPGGAPIAARKIPRPSFPAQIILGPDDSMLGNELPATGTITIRLDLDGSASTRDESELSAEIDAVLGEPITVRLH